MPKLTAKDYLKTTMRSYLLQNGFNYNTYQGNGYLNVILPALKKIYSDNPEELQEVAEANVEFYNTNPHMLPFITNMQLAMYDEGIDKDNARSIKMALMGPLAGIGDSIAQFGLAPLFSTIFAGLALDGLGFSPMAFWASMIVSMLAIKLLMGHAGYTLGTTFIDTMSENIAKITNASNIVGITVISALASTFVKANIGIQYTTVLETGEEQIVAIQTILDQIMPRLLPVLITGLVFYLVKYKKWNTYQLLLLLFVIGILGSLTGVLV